VLRLTTKQLDVLGVAPYLDFVEETALLCHEHFPRECARLERSQVTRVVQTAMRNAHFHGFRSRREHVYFAFLAFMLGSGFATDRMFPWAVRQGAPLAAAQPRIASVFDMAVAYVEQTAGDELQHLLRAMVRIRSFDRRSLPATDPIEPGFVDHALALMMRLYPEPWHEMPELRARTLVAESIERGVELGLVRADGALVYLATRCLLGHEVARDPLYPWASRVFEDPFAAPEQLADDLYAAAMKHLESSLREDAA